MAHAITTVNVQTLTSQAPATGAVVESAAELVTSDILTRGLYVHTQLTSSAFSAYPGGYLGDSPALVVSLMPRHATGGDEHEHGELTHTTVHELDSSMTFTTKLFFSTFFAGALPEFSVIRTQNRTDTSIAANTLNQWIEHTGESTV